MATSASIAVLYGVLAGVANLAGAWACVRGTEKSEHRRIATVRGLGAGFLAGVVLLDAVPGALSAWRGQVWVPVGLAVLGYGALFLVERFVERFHHHGADCHHQAEHLSTAAAWTGVLGLSVHTLLDGAAVVGAGHHGTLNAGFAALGLMVHQGPVGASAAALLRSTGAGPSAALRAGGLLAVSSVTGAVLFAFMDRLAPFAVPVLAGVTTHVVFHDLLPTLPSSPRWRSWLAFLVGMTVYGATEFLVPVH